jgi:hypothetical protein
MVMLVSLFSCSSDCGFSVRESELFAKEILRRAVSGLADGDLLV